MPLYGTFDTMQLADLAQWLQSNRQSGRLAVTVQDDETYLEFRDGDLVAVSSGDPLHLDVGQVLLARGIVSEDQLHAALGLSRDGESVAEALVQMEIVPASVVERVQEDHVFETLLDLFFHRSGSFHFSSAGSLEGLLDQGEDRPRNVLRKPISTQNLLVEAMRRLDEWERIRQTFPSSYAVVYALEGESELPVWKELKKIGEPISIGALCLRMSGSRFDVYSQLYLAYNTGLVALDQMLAGQEDHQQLGSVDVLVENARVLIAEQQYDEAREVLGTAINLAPDSRDARQLLDQLRESQLEYLYQQIPPHRTVTLTVPRGELAGYDLTPRENYLASRLDGRWDVATLVVATPLGELETLRILRKFLHARIAKISG